MSIRSDRNRVFIATAFTCFVLLSQALLGQNTETPNIETGPRFGDPQPVYFEIGMKITSNGHSSGLTGTVPIPIDWPEQKITIVSRNKTDNLRNISFKDMTKEIRQMILKANRLGPGEVAQGTVVVRADRSIIKKPAEPEKLVFANTVPSKLKQYLKPSPYIECKDKKIISIAESIELDSKSPAWNQVEQIYKWVRENIEYKFDKKIHSCIDALETGVGDCEELSSVFIAICRARGIPARAVWIPSHTYPEFYLEDERGNGFWFPCQAAGSYEFGEMSELRPILQKGDRFKVPGNKKPLRYVQPTLVARDSSGGLKIEFITREITNENELKTRHIPLRN